MYNLENYLYYNYLISKERSVKYINTKSDYIDIYLSIINENEMHLKEVFKSVDHIYLYIGNKVYIFYIDSSITRYIDYSRSNFIEFISYCEKTDYIIYNFTKVDNIVEYLLKNHEEIPLLIFSNFFNKKLMYINDDVKLRKVGTNEDQLSNEYVSIEKSYLKAKDHLFFNLEFFDLFYKLSYNHLILLLKMQIAQPSFKIAHKLVNNFFKVISSSNYQLKHFILHLFLFYSSPDFEQVNLDKFESNLGHFIISYIKNLNMGIEDDFSIFLNNNSSFVDKFVLLKEIGIFISSLFEDFYFISIFNISTRIIDKVSYKEIKFKTRKEYLDLKSDFEKNLQTKGDVDFETDIFISKDMLDNFLKIKRISKLPFVIPIQEYFNRTDTVVNGNYVTDENVLEKSFVSSSSGKGELVVNSTITDILNKLNKIPYTFNLALFQIYQYDFENLIYKSKLWKYDKLSEIHENNIDNFVFEIKNIIKKYKKNFRVNKTYKDKNFLFEKLKKNFIDLSESNTFIASDKKRYKSLLLDIQSSLNIIERNKNTIENEKFKHVSIIRDLDSLCNVYKYFYIPHGIDFRGRIIQNTTYINIRLEIMYRHLFMFNKKKAYTKEDIRLLKISILSAIFGSKEVSYNDLLSKWDLGYAFIEDFIDFLKNFDDFEKFWYFYEKLVEPEIFFAYALEYIKYLYIPNYESNVLIWLDATTSVVQNMVGYTWNDSINGVVNLKKQTFDDKIGDFYQYFITQVMLDLSEDTRWNTVKQDLKNLEINPLISFFYNYVDIKLICKENDNIIYYSKDLKSVNLVDFEFDNYSYLVIFNLNFGDDIYIFDFNINKLYKNLLINLKKKDLLHCDIKYFFLILFFKELKKELKKNVYLEKCFTNIGISFYGEYDLKNFSVNKLLKIILKTNKKDWETYIDNYWDDFRKNIKIKFFDKFSNLRKIFKSFVMPRLYGLSLYGLREKLFIFWNEQIDILGSYEDNKVLFNQFVEFLNYSLNKQDISKPFEGLKYLNKISYFGQNFLKNLFNNLFNFIEFLNLYYEYLNVFKLNDKSIGYLEIKKKFKAFYKKNGQVKNYGKFKKSFDKLKRRKRKLKKKQIFSDMTDNDLIEIFISQLDNFIKIDKVQLKFLLKKEDFLEFYLNELINICKKAKKNLNDMITFFDMIFTYTDSGLKFKLDLHLEQNFDNNNKTDDINYNQFKHKYFKIEKNYFVISYVHINKILLSLEGTTKERENKDETNIDKVLEYKRLNKQKFLKSKSRAKRTQILYTDERNYAKETRSIVPNFIQGTDAVIMLKTLSFCFKEDIDVAPLCDAFGIHLADYNKFLKLYKKNFYEYFENNNQLVEYYLDAFIFYKSLSIYYLNNYSKLTKFLERDFFDMILNDNYKDITLDFDEIDSIISNFVKNKNYFDKLDKNNYGKLNKDLQVLIDVLNENGILLEKLIKDFEANKGNLTKEDFFENKYMLIND